MNDYNYDSYDWDSFIQADADTQEFGTLDTGRDSFIPSPSMSQEPTPFSYSMDSLPTVDESDETIVSVSTAFNADAHFDPLPPDLIIVSSNSVIFYVHSHIVHYSSDPNSPLRPPTPPSESYVGYNALSNHESLVKHVSESADVLNIILHTAYNVSCAQYFPSFQDLATAVKTLSRYGVDPKGILPNTSLYAVLLSHAPTSSLDLYALAAHYDLYDLAVATSPHLLSLSLCTLTDEMATRIGPVYLRRLFFLHLGRADALRRVLRAPPHTHAPTSTCGPAEQKNLATAWALTASYLTWNPRPDLSTNAMQAMFSALSNETCCNLCQHALLNRIKTLILQWSVIKRTI